MSATTSIAGMRGLIIALMIAVIFGTPGAAHDVARPEWKDCYKACIEALEKSDTRPASCRSLKDREDRATCKALREAEGDGGRAFGHFKTCNTLCR